MRPAAVIFDLDDTLFDHTGAATAGVSAWLADLELEPSADRVAFWFDAENRWSTAWNRGQIGFREQRRVRLTETLEHAGYRAIPTAPDDLDHLFTRYLAHYETAWRAFDDVAPALARLDGVPVAVLTNGAQELQTRKIAALGIGDSLVMLACCDAIGFAKPDPRAYRHVCDALAVEPAETLHVGDRHDLDVIGAREAGLRAVHLDRRGAGPAHEPDRIETLRELLT